MTKLPAGPLHDLIRRRAKEYAHNNDNGSNGSLNELAEHVAVELNTTPSAAGRAIARVLALAEISLARADRYATALGSHPGELWGWDVYGKDVA